MTTDLVDHRHHLFLFCQSPWMVTCGLLMLKRSLGKKIAFGFLAWLFILVLTTAYHLGYADFRSKRLSSPNKEIPLFPSTLVSGNPIGSPVVHGHHAHHGYESTPPKPNFFYPLTGNDEEVESNRSHCGIRIVLEDRRSRLSNRDIIICQDYRIALF